MAFDKYFYKQFKDQIQKEVKEFEAKEEVKEVKFPKCQHKDVKFVNGELRCRCGAGWRGAGISKLYSLLTKKN